MNNITYTTRFLIIKNTTLEKFEEKISGNYLIQVSYSNKLNTSNQTFDLNFNWGEMQTYSFERRINDQNFAKEISYLTPRLYSCPRNINALDNNGEILPKDELIKYRTPIVTILEQNNDLLLIIKGGDDDQSKIKHKLLGGKGASQDSKNKWKDAVITDRSENTNLYNSDFLLWLISKSDADYSFECKNNQKFRIVDIISLQDDGVNKQIKRKGVGFKLLDDPIVKAIIAGVENISGLGFSIVFENENIIEFILNSDGCIELLDTCKINLPLYISSSHPHYFEIMTHIIYNEILPVFINEFNQNSENWNLTEKYKLRLNYCIQTTQNLCQILNINFSNSVNKEGIINKLTIE